MASKRIVGLALSLLVKLTHKGELSVKSQR